MSASYQITFLESTELCTYFSYIKIEKSYFLLSLDVCFDGFISFAAKKISFTKIISKGKCYLNHSSYATISYKFSDCNNIYSLLACPQAKTSYFLMFLLSHYTDVEFWYICTRPCYSYWKDIFQDPSSNLIYIVEF